MLGGEGAADGCSSGSAFCSHCAGGLLDVDMVIVASTLVDLRMRSGRVGRRGEVETSSLRVVGGVVEGEGQRTGSSLLEMSAVLTGGALECLRAVECFLAPSIDMFMLALLPSIVSGSGKEVSCSL